jgi:hypothetical protein
MCLLRKRATTVAALIAISIATIRPTRADLITLASFDGTTTKANPTYGLVLDAQGNLYGATNGGSQVGIGDSEDFFGTSTSLLEANH